MNPQIRKRASLAEHNFSRKSRLCVSMESPSVHRARASSIPSSVRQLPEAKTESRCVIHASGGLSRMLDASAPKVICRLKHFPIIEILPR